MSAKKSGQIGGSRRARVGADETEDATAGERLSKAACRNASSGEFEVLPELITMTKARNLAKKGHPEAQWRLATMYYYGTNGLRPNLDLSLTWYKLACDGGLPKAVHDMACFYADGVPDRIERDTKKAVQLWQQAANAGHVEAMTALGGAYDEGTGTDVDRTIAFEWFKTASSHGDASASYMLGWYYDVGFAPGGQSAKKANAAYQVASSRGDAVAMYQLGRNMLHGRGTANSKPDDKRAFALFSQSAEAGCGMGAFQLGWMLRNGRGCETDEAEAVRWFKESAKQGCADGLVALSQCFLAGTAGLPVDLPEAERLARDALRLAADSAAQATDSDGRHTPKLAAVRGISDDLLPFVSTLGRAGDAATLPTDQRREATAEAAFALGACLEARHSLHDAESLKEAFFCYLLAARHGHADGMHNVGAMLDVGQVATQNHKAAAAWYHQAAQHGDHSSMYALALAHRAGRGVLASDEQAVKWYRRAAEHGHARAWNKLGWMLEQGAGCKQSDVGAIEAYRSAALQGSAKAMCHMAALHRDGRCGLQTSATEARKWFAAAARAGSVLAEEQLALLGVQDWRVVEQEVLRSSSARSGAAAPPGGSSASSTGSASDGNASDSSQLSPRRGRGRQRRRRR